MAIKTVATSPSNTMIAIFHFFCFSHTSPPYWPVIQYYFTKTRGKANDMTVKEKEAENTTLKPLFIYLFLRSSAPMTGYSVNPDAASSSTLFASSVFSSKSSLGASFFS